MLSLLAQGNNGNEILQILDTLIDDNQSAVAYAEPTADVIEFWCLRGAQWLTLSAPYVRLYSYAYSAVIVSLRLCALRA